MPDVLWYYARNDQQFGPVSAGELKHLVDAGRLSPDDLLWREGMDAWTTAINLRGLFAEEPSGAGNAGNRGAASAIEGAGTRSRDAGSAGRQAESASPPSVLRTTQVILWSMCVLVVLAGVVLFTRAFLAAKDANEEAAAGAVFSTFFIGAYVLARCGEKLSKLLMAIGERRSR